MGRPKRSISVCADPKCTSCGKVHDTKNPQFFLEEGRQSFRKIEEEDLVCFVKFTDLFSKVSIGDIICLACRSKYGLKSNKKRKKHDSDDELLTDAKRIADKERILLKKKEKEESDTISAKDYRG